MNRDDERIPLARLVADRLDEHAAHHAAVGRLPRDLFLVAERDFAANPRIRIGELRPLRLVADVAQRRDGVRRRRRLRIGVVDDDAAGLRVARRPDVVRLEIGELLHLARRDRRARRTASSRGTPVLK